MCGRIIYILYLIWTISEVLALTAQISNMAEKGEMSRSIKLPQTIDIALRNIKDAKVTIGTGNSVFMLQCSRLISTI